VAYQSQWLADAVVTCLRSRPATRLKDLAAIHKVSVATVGRALRLHRGTSFRELQSSCLRARAGELLETAPAKSLKEVAHTVGYAAPRAFSKRLKALGGWPARSAVTRPAGQAARAMGRSRRCRLGVGGVGSSPRPSGSALDSLVPRG
jgi:transcriptional regulator GlxA family with amidase domain